MNHKEALEKILTVTIPYQESHQIATEALQSESEQPTSPSIEKEDDFPLKIWANIYNPLKTSSWDLHKSENAAVKNSIGAKTHLYIHESIANNHLDEFEKWLNESKVVLMDTDVLRIKIQELKTLKP